MSVQKKTKQKRLRRKLRVKYNIQRKGLVQGLRVSVFRSLKHIYAQIIDDQDGKTIVSYSTLLLKEAVGDKRAQARMVGRALAERAKEKNIVQAIFDRGPFLYHGRIKELAEGLREGGLQI